MRDQLGEGLAASQVQPITDVHEYSVVAKIMTVRQNKNSLSTDLFLSSTTVLPAGTIYLDGYLLLSFLTVFYTHKHREVGGKKKNKNTSVIPTG